MYLSVPNIVIKVCTTLILENKSIYLSTHENYMESIISSTNWPAASWLCVGNFPTQPASHLPKQPTQQENCVDTASHFYHQEGI